jgi:uncharacterized protein
MQCRRRKASVTKHGIDLESPDIRDLCAKWKIKRLAVFGSVLRDDFRPDSDIDLLVEFEPDTEWGLFDLIKAEEDFARLFQRRVDFVPRDRLKWVIRDRVLESAVLIYAA